MRLRYHLEVKSNLMLLQGESDTSGVIGLLVFRVTERKETDNLCLEYSPPPKTDAL